MTMQQRTKRPSPISGFGTVFDFLKPFGQQAGKQAYNVTVPPAQEAGSNIVSNVGRILNTPGTGNYANPGLSRFVQSAPPLDFLNITPTLTGSAQTPLPGASPFPAGQGLSGAPAPLPGVSDDNLKRIIDSFIAGGMSPADAEKRARDIFAGLPGVGTSPPVSAAPSNNGGGSNPNTATQTGDADRGIGLDKTLNTLTPQGKYAKYFTAARAGKFGDLEAELYAEIEKLYALGVDGKIDPVSVAKADQLQSMIDRLNAINDQASGRSQFGSIITQLFPQIDPQLLANLDPQLALQLIALQLQQGAGRVPLPAPKVRVMG